MTDSTKAPAYKFAINIPVKLRVRFVDVRPGKLWADPEKGGAMKKLPAQVSIKGSFDGVDTIAFLPGAVWKNVKALIAAGIIGPQDTDALEAVEQNTALPVLASEEFTATLAKPAGAKYADMVYTLTSAQTAASKRVASPHHSAPEKKLPFDEGYEAEAPHLAPNPANAKLHGGPMPGPLQGEDDEPSPLDAKQEAEEIQREALRAAYTNLYVLVLDRMGKAHQHNAPNVPLDSMAVQAATATVWLTWKDRGLIQGIATAALQAHADGAE